MPRWSNRPHRTGYSIASGIIIGSIRMEKKSYTVLGLMSGSSLDGLDIACCQFTINPKASDRTDFLVDWHLAQAATIRFSEQWQGRLAYLPAQDALTFAKTNTYFGHYTGELVNAFLQKFDLKPDFIAAHGHTIFHYPDKRLTVQIGDGAALAATTGLPVVCDFRTHDIAIDGEGAPLAPLADQLLLPGYDFYLNLGGIANVSASIGDRFVAFDIGPANQVLNALANQLDIEYDDEGKIAASGEVITTLLHEVNDIAYFRKMYPKSPSVSK
ncbi:MAG: anhydro-N-acetylmuramic acid kinase [Bacteroidota bacterium]